LHPSEHLIEQAIGAGTGEALEDPLHRHRVTVDRVERTVVIETASMAQDSFEFGRVLVAQTSLRIVDQQAVLPVSSA
jgi:hypothetical protein